MTASRIVLLLVGLFASGVIALATSIGAWPGYGDRTFIVATVMATYFLGLALGWLLFGRRA